MTPEEIRSSPKYSLIRSLFDGTIPFFDVLNDPAQKKDFVPGPDDWEYGVIKMKDK